MSKRLSLSELVLQELNRNDWQFFILRYTSNSYLGWNTIQEVLDGDIPSFAALSQIAKIFRLDEAVVFAAADETLLRAREKFNARLSSKQVRRSWLWTKDG